MDSTTEWNVQQRHRRPTAEQMLRSIAAAVQQNSPACLAGRGSPAACANNELRPTQSRMPVCHHRVYYPKAHASAGITAR